MTDNTWGFVFGGRGLCGSYVDIRELVTKDVGFLKPYMYLGIYIPER